MQYICDLNYRSFLPVPVFVLVHFKVEITDTKKLFNFYEDIYSS